VLLYPWPPAFQWHNPEYLRDRHRPPSQIPALPVFFLLHHLHCSHNTPVIPQLLVTINIRIKRGRRGEGGEEIERRRGDGGGGRGGGLGLTFTLTTTTTP